MTERDKDISDIRKERDDAVRLLEWLIYATHHAPPCKPIADVRDKALNWLKRKGLGSEILRNS